MMAFVKGYRIRLAIHRWFLVACLLPVACGKAGLAASPATTVAMIPAASGLAATPSTALLDVLPGDGAVLVGMNRDVPEDVRFEALQWIAAQTSQYSLPTCFYQVIAKLDHAAATMEPLGGSLPAFAARGEGLHSAVDACLKSIDPELIIETHDGITIYRDPGQSIFRGTWLDDATFVFGVDTIEAARGPVGPVSARVSNGGRLEALLREVNTSNRLWFVVDVLKLATSWPSGVPQPSNISGEMVQSSLMVTAILASPAEAGELATRLRLLRKQLPEDLAAISVDATVTVEKNRLVLDLPVGKMIARWLGKDEATIPKTAISIVAAGIVTRIAIPASW